MEAFFMSAPRLKGPSTFYLVSLSLIRAERQLNSRT